MMEEFSLGEVSAPTVPFCNIPAGKIDRSFVEYFFGKPVTNKESCRALNHINANFYT